MATTWTLTAGGIILAALKKLGVYGAGGTLGTNDAADGIIALNALVKNWMWGPNSILPGIKIWQYAYGTITLAAVGTYTVTYSTATPLPHLAVDPPLNFASILLRNTSTVDTPLEEISMAEWDALPNKTASGVPTQFYYQRAMGTGLLRLNRIPAAADFAANPYLICNYQRILTDITTVTDTIDAPQQWVRPLIYNLAIEMAPDYGRVVGQEIVTIAAQSLMIANSANPENSEAFFQPEWDY